MNKTLSGFYDYSELYMERVIAGQAPQSHTPCFNCRQCSEVECRFNGL